MEKEKKIEIEKVDYLELYKQQKNDIINNDKSYVYYEIVVGENNAIKDINSDKADAQTFAMFYSMLKEEVEEIEKDYPIIPIIAKAIYSEGKEIDY